ncbi:MAG TPA: hypothetical protein ENI23_06960 [bacterium]|nr:hypothetical protein [bacterium]
MHSTFAREILKTPYFLFYADGSYNVSTEEWRLNSDGGDMEWDELLDVLSSTKMQGGNIKMY